MRRYLRLHAPLALGFLLLTAAAPAWSAERGCDRLTWPLEKERQALLAAGNPTLATGATLKPQQAVTLRLAPLTEARLPTPPERAPKIADAFAGFLQVDAPAGQAAAVTLVTVSADAWIDVVQAGRYLKPEAFTGALECPGVRKSMKYSLARPYVIQFSNVKDATIGVIVSAPE